MAYLRRADEMVLLDESVAATGAIRFLAMRPPYTKHPRFQLNVSSFVAGGSPAGIIQIEHALLSDTDVEILGIIEFNAAGTFHLYSENLTTQHPFPKLRANVIQLTNITSFVGRLVGTFDRSE